MTPMGYTSTAAAMAMALAVVAPSIRADGTSIPGGDVLARCQSIVASASAATNAAPPTFVTFSVPDEIAPVLAAKSIDWDKLSDTMRIGILWAYGYVLPGSENGAVDKSWLFKVYTDCSSATTVNKGINDDVLGVPMNAIEITKDAFNATACTQNECGDFFKANNTGCSPKLQTKIQCAIQESTTHQAPKATGSFWSSASGGVSTIPRPQVYAQQVPLSSRGPSSDSSSSFSGSVRGGDDDSLAILTIQMAAADSDVACASSGDAVIPCLAFDSIDERKFCRPKVDEKALNEFLDTITSKLPVEVTTGSDAGSESGGLSTGAIIGIVGGALVVLGLVAFYFFRNGRKASARKNSTGDPTYIGFDPKLAGQGSDARRNLDRVNTGGFAVMGDNDTVFSTDMNHSGGGGGGPTQLDESMRAPGGRPYQSTLMDSGMFSSRTRVSSIGSSMRGPFGKTEEDYKEESDILREFLTDPHILMRRIPHEELTTLRILSKGSYGEVYLGQLETRHVAMKRLLQEKRHMIRSIEQFTSEIRLMTSLEHRNIVSFIGVSWDYVPNICAVVEYMDNGDLAEVLAKSKGKLTWPKEKISISMDIAEGLVYLHSMRPVIVHRDLKSKNVLLNKRGQAKLSDFGVSRKTTVNETMTSGVGTLLWTAPEIIEGRKYSEKADIFSLGVVLSEIDTGEEPYASMKNDTNSERLPGMQIVQMVRLGELKVRFRDDCPPKIRELAEQCTSLDPDMRPTSMEVAYTLKSIIAPMLRR